MAERDAAQHLYRLPHRERQNTKHQQPSSRSSPRWRGDGPMVGLMEESIGVGSMDDDCIDAWWMDSTVQEGEDEPLVGSI